jgi:hypothetical protein
MPSVFTTILGAVAPLILPHAVIVGRSQENFGDPVDDSGSNFNPTGAYVPLGWGTENRLMALYNLDVRDVEGEKQLAQITRALFAPAFFQRFGTPALPFNLLFYEMEGTLLPGTTWLNRSTGVPWYGGGYGPRPGYDFDRTPLGKITIDAALWASIPEPPSASTTISRAVELTGAVGRARDERRPLPLLVMVDFPFATNAALRLDWAPNEATTLHSTLTIDWRPAIGIHSALADEAGRPADLANLHSPARAGTGSRTYYGQVQQGTISDEKKLWAVNHRSGPRIGVVVGTSRAEPTAVDNSASVSGIRLKSADVYDRDTTTSPEQWTPPGDYVVAPQSTNTYSVEFTDEDGAAVTLLEYGTGNTVVSMAADHTFVVDAKLALTIRAIKWRDGLDALATTGLSTSDRFRFSVRADSRTTESLAMLEMARVMPPDSRPFGDTADTLRARPLAHAFSQQMWAGAIDRDIAGIVRTHLRMRDTSKTDWLTGSDAWVDAFLPGNETIVSARIATVFPSDDGSYPDELRLDVQLSAPNLALLASDAAFVTGGVALGNLGRMTLRKLSVAATQGVESITLDKSLPAAPAEVQIISDSVGTQRVGVTSGTRVLELAAPLAHSFPAGASVFVIFNPATAPESMYSKPYFTNARVPTGQEEGSYTGFYEVYEVTPVAPHEE